jgi:hypothetical protein
MLKLESGWRRNHTIFPIELCENAACREVVANELALYMKRPSAKWSVMTATTADTMFVPIVDC